MEHLPDTYFSGVTITLNIFIDIASGLFAGALVVKMAFPDLSLTTIIWAISLFAAFYTLLGGLASVVYSDTVQAVLLIFSSIVVTVLAFNLTGGVGCYCSGCRYRTSNYNPSGKRSRSSLARSFLRCIPAGILLLGNKSVHSSTRTSREGYPSGSMGSTLCRTSLNSRHFLSWYCPELWPSSSSRIWIDPKNAYPTLIFNLLPAGLLGLTLAGFIAALMSSVDSGTERCIYLIYLRFLQKV